MTDNDERKLVAIGHLSDSGDLKLYHLIKTISSFFTRKSLELSSINFVHFKVPLSWSYWRGTKTI